MASDLAFVEYVYDQISGAGGISFKKMFGEYALYRNGKIVALVCDNQLFIKPTAGGRSVLGEVTEAPPYPGAKSCFLIGDRIEDRTLMSNVIKITTDELPLPKPRKPKPKKAKK